MKNNKAFSLIELSIVILVVGIIIAGVTNSSSLVRKFRLSSAVSLTKSSPILSIYGLEAWYETTLSDSFRVSESSDGSEITGWLNIKSQSALDIPATPPATNNRPKYIEGAFNGAVPGVRFDGVDDFLIVNGLSVVTKEITVFVVANRRAISGDASTLTLFSSSASNDWADSRSFVPFYEGGSGGILQTFNSNAARSTTNHPGNNYPYIATTVFDGSRNTIYLNGTAGSLASSSPSLSINVIRIGSRHQPIPAYYNGDIAEIIVFSRALKNEDRRSVEQYLSKKYSIKIS